MENGFDSNQNRTVIYPAGICHWYVFMATAPCILMHVCIMSEGTKGETFATVPQKKQKTGWRGKFIILTATVQVITLVSRYRGINLFAREYVFVFYMLCKTNKQQQQQKQLWHLHVKKRKRKASSHKKTISMNFIRYYSVYLSNCNTCGFTQAEP